MWLKKTVQALRDVLFPKACPVCEVMLPKSEIICESCWPQLHFTHWQMDAQNPLAQRCRVLFDCQKAYALMYYHKNEPGSGLIKQLKYGHQQEIGQWLAERCWAELKPNIHDFDAICPVPLHPKKQQERGYHQLQVFCETLSAKSGIPIQWALKRLSYENAQAKKNKQEREQALATFAIDQNLAPSHILLVDDVFTTGNTISRCAWPLLKAGHRVSVLCFAFDDDGI
jgi:competence protein ComFC